ncbi:unnamed protein product, partial [marine sediment metagenome]
DTSFHEEALELNQSHYEGLFIKLYKIAPEGFETNRTHPVKKKYIWYNNQLARD